uniref:Sema domain-containing protein n=1 Tax=Macrostomum lignano TaxID=282301 RepID=A0A1I8HEI0_9PLAT
MQSSPLIVVAGAAAAAAAAATYRTDRMRQSARLPLIIVVLLVWLTALGKVESLTSSPSAVSLQSLIEARLAKPFLFREHSNFTHIAVVPMQNPEFIYVAVPNHIIKVGLKTFEDEEIIEWSTKPDATDSDLRNCQLQGAARANCPQNIIFALQATNDFKLLVCGSVRGTPNCSLRSAMQPKISFGSYTIQLQNSDLQSEKVIALEDKQIFVGAFLRPGRADPAIYRSSLVPSSDAIRTKQDKQLSQWMKFIYKPAKFISVHIVGDYVYYFFQENFEEMGTCGTRAERTVSRVARVCKSDPGYQHLWLSYAKSRLVCSDGGPTQTDARRTAEPFYYDLLQDTFVTDSHIYGVFTASRHGVRASAVCGFPFSIFNQVFGDQSVKVKKSESREGTPMSYFVEARDQYNRSDCPSLHLHKDDIGEYELSHNWQYFLKSQWTVPDTNQPLAATGTEIWLRILIERLPSIEPGQWHSVAYILTERHSIKKILLAEGNRCVLDEISLDPRLDGKINDMKLLPGGRLLISTDTRLVQLPTSRCNLLTSQEACLAARDPHCGWNLPAAACTVRPANTDQWRQEVSASAGRVCPRLPTSSMPPSEGGVAAWSEWSPWQRCLGSEGFCQCRVRFEAGIVGGLEAAERPRQHQQEVANCSRDGAWSAWSSWSRCERIGSGGGGGGSGASCAGQQTRSRRCDSPRPAHGGADCRSEGSSRTRSTTDSEDAAETEERVCKPDECQVNRPNTASAAWSAWSAWSACSQRCGTGSRSRRRQCRAEGAPTCQGDSQQRQPCNEQPCPGLEGRAPTSQWVPVRSDWPSGGVTASQSRWVAFGAVCKLRHDASGGRRQWLEVELANFTKLCDSAGGNCRQEAAPTPHWSEWSCWSNCVAMDANACDGTGRRKRQRVCIGSELGSGSCGGIAVDATDCQMNVCEAYSDWSQWSSCSRIESGTRSRSRSCRRVANCQAASGSGTAVSDPTGGLSQLQSQLCGALRAAAAGEAPIAQPSAEPALKVGGSASIGESGKLSYPLVAAICLAVVLASCLASGTAVGCYQRRRLAKLRQRMRDLQLELDQLRALPHEQASSSFVSDSLANCGSGGGG